MTVFKEQPNLLEQYRRGAPAALELVYRRYLHDVKRYLAWQARRVGVGFLARSDLIDELCQDVFLKAFSRNARAAFDGNRAYRPYLKTIAKNTVIDFARTLHRHSDIDEDRGTPGHLLDDRWHFNESLPQTLATLREHLAELPAPLARVFHERFILDHSQETTAKTLELSRGQVRSLEHQLRSSLKRRLTASGIHEV